MLSVIIPAFNEEAMVPAAAQTIDDLLDQRNLPVQAGAFGIGDAAKGEHQRFFTLPYAVKAAAYNEQRHGDDAQRDHKTFLHRFESHFQ